MNICIPKAGMIRVAAELGLVYTKRIPRKEKRYLRRFIIAAATDRAIDAWRNDLQNNCSA